MASPALSLSTGLRAGSTVVRRPSVWTVWTSVAIPVVLIVGWIVADAVQPASYSPVRQTVSVAAGLGAHHRWVMTGALMVVAACYVLTAVGLSGLWAWARWWLMATGLSAFAIAMLPQPAGGTTAQHALVTGVGAVLMAGWPVLVRGAGPADPLLFGPRVTAAVAVVFLALLAWLVVETRGGAILGLAERVCSGVQVCWPAVVVLAMRRRVGSPSPLPARRRPTLW